MKTFTFIPELETDYTKNGNSSGESIDTLAIAVVGYDYNEMSEDCIDNIFEAEDIAMEYWLNNECEAYFDSTLSKEDAAKYAEDLDAYNEALKEYKDMLRDTREELPGDHPYVRARHEAIDEASSELWHDWLFGDYHSNFAGVIPIADRHYSDYGIEFSYDDKKDVLSITVEDPEATGEALINDGYIDAIDRLTKKSITMAIESIINYKAANTHADKMRKREARRIENEKTRVYKQERIEATKNAKREKLRAIANK